MRNMAVYQKIIKHEFPSIDLELLDYVSGVLDGGEEFNNVDDVYEAIGGVLHEVNLDKDEDCIRTICRKLYKTLQLNGGENQQNAILLDAPVQLSEQGLEDESTNDDKSIWMATRENVSQVNKKKLEKAEAKLKAKQERRLLQPDQPVKQNGMVSASASQAVSRKDVKAEAAGTSRATDIRIENFDIAFGEKVLLKEASFTLAFGRRYGLVGRNGAGKSTLLKMIASRELQFQSHISILHVEQEVIGDDTLAIDSVLECDELRTKLLKDEKELHMKIHDSGCTDPSLGAKLSDVYAKLAEIEADKAPSRAAMILNGLGFSSNMQSQTTKEFSGGWRMRIALARALFSKPDLLLLDEPTNMLDIKAILWLENYLQDWPTTLLIVSHDKKFLNEVATDMIHQHSKRLDAYKGNYEQFFKTKTEKHKNQQREYEAQMQFRAHVQTFIDRFRYNANRAALVQSKIKQLEKLPKLIPVEKESEVILRFPAELQKLSPPILQLDEVSFSYGPDVPIFGSVDLSANMESRICIVGENGSGKTTLLKILLGEFNPVAGIRHCHRNLRIGYFSQHHIDTMKFDKNAIEVMASRFPGKQIEQYRQQLGSFGVTGDLATRPVSSLSGGQKSRVVFALMCAGNPNFFILDEPTNHLDIETVEALGKALSSFKGGVILVSHDESLIRVVCKELWVCGEGSVRAMEGGLDEYKKMVEKEFEQQR
ncbi:ATP-binding cassette sub-family F member 3-like isoform X2 [Lytechinus pictus]|uniref:ATP-binding cassette sub-family F member 3-like isoform X2 n=1 Tax=Lytechinus pictus TaxID=7653 RepID=UPI0030B9CA0E